MYVNISAGLATSHIFLLQQKMGLMRTVARLMEQEAMTRCEACRDVNIRPSMHLIWTKQAEAMMDLKKTTIRAKSLHSGRTHRRFVGLYIRITRKRNGSDNTDGGGEGSSNF